jgi:hypothetical protein
MNILSIQSDGDSCAKIISSQILSIEKVNDDQDRVTIRVTLDKDYSGCGIIQISFTGPLGEIILDFYDHSIVSGIDNVIVIEIPKVLPPNPNPCNILVRLKNCCQPSPSPSCDPQPFPPSEGGSCECSTANCDDFYTEITDPYILPNDYDKPLPYNPIIVPKNFTIKINQNGCVADASIFSDICRAPDPGFCVNNFFPNIDIYTLPQIIPNCPLDTCGRPIDLDTECPTRIKCPTYDETAGVHTNFELYYITTNTFTNPTIDCVVYDISNLPIGTIIKIHQTSTDTEMRQWVCNHFRFLNKIGTPGSCEQFPECDYLAAWPFNDLYWIPFLQHPLADPNTVYINLIPC